MTPKTRQYAEVKSVSNLGRDMKRIVFHGGTLAAFPNIQPGAYIKLLFDTDGQPIEPDDAESVEISMRTYTVRAFNPVTRYLTVDFVLHNQDGHAGPASSWAASAQPGDILCFAGPGRSKPLIEDYDFAVFAGDLTALPTMEAYLEQLPHDTQGVAVIAAGDRTNIRDIVTPKGVELIWLTEPEARLTSALALVPKPRNKVAIWAAAEFSQMREMRQLFTQNWQIPRTDIYISSYWKAGRSEDQHKLDKRKDAEAQSAS